MECEATVTDRIEAYRFNEAAQTLYHFIWQARSATGIWNSPNRCSKGKTRPSRPKPGIPPVGCSIRFCACCIRSCPFITEELWEAMAESRDTPLIRSAWPKYRRKAAQRLGGRGDGLGGPADHGYPFGPV